MKLRHLCSLAVLASCALLAHAQLTVASGGTVQVGSPSSSGSTNATTLQGQAVSATAPTDLQILQWNGTGNQWQPTSLNVPTAGSCATGTFMTAIVQGTSPSCAAISYSQLTGVPTNLVTFSGTITPGQFAQFLSSGVIQPVSSTGAGSVVLNSSPSFLGNPTAPIVTTCAPNSTIATQSYVQTCGGSAGGGMVYPGAGIAVSNGSGWTGSVAAPSSALVGVSDTQTLTNKSIDASELSSGTLNHARLPALVSSDIPNNTANTSGTAGGLSGSPAISVAGVNSSAPVTVTGGTAGVGNNGAWWTVTAGVPTGGCSNGSIDTNSSATSSSSALYVCVSGGWLAMTGAAATGTETVGNLGEWDFDGSDASTPTSTGTPAQTTSAYTSPYAMEYNAATQYSQVSITSSTTLYSRFYLEINTHSTANLRVLDLYNGASEIGNLFLNGSNQFLTFTNSLTSTATTCATQSMSSATYHLVELYWTANATTGAFTVRIDGTTTCQVTGVNTGTAGINIVRFGEVNAPASPWDISIDNVGLSNSGWLGSVTP